MEQVASLEIVAKRAWVQAVSDFYNPPLPDPVIEHDEESASFFYIDSGSWTVHLNTVGVPLNIDPNDAESYLRSICHHEIQHYLLCPYDGVTNGMMFAGARKHLPDNLAMFICNIFADLVVDSHLLKKHPDITHSRITMSIHDSALRTRDHSVIWKLIIAAYRWMWGFPIPAGVDISKETILAAKEVTEIAKQYLDQESKWPKATELIAKIVKEWLPDPEDPFGGTGLSEGTGDDSILVPIDLDGVMGSPVENRNCDRAKRCVNPDETVNQDEEMERIAIEVEERGGSLRDLEGTYVMLGGTGRKDWVRFWYRAKVRGLLRFHVRQMRPQGSAPLSPTSWRLGDPIEELDVVQSLQAFPVLVPNMSTRKWLRTVSYGEDPLNELPDLLVVLDSSGSMTYSMGTENLRGAYYTALVSAFAAMDTAFRQGARVAAINFSGDIIKSDWTRNRSDIEDILMTYQGGGTVIPVKTIRALCTEASSKVMSIIITDAGISNWNPFIKTLSKLTNLGHKMFIFHIGGKKSKVSKTEKEITKAGAFVVPVSSVKDLPGLVVSEVRRTYLHDT